LMEDAELILELSKREMTFINVLSQIRLDFISYYALKIASISPFSSTVEEKLLSLLGHEDSKFYYKINSIYDTKNEYVIGLKNWIRSGYIKAPEEILKNKIISTLRNESRTNFDLTKLTFYLNRKPLNVGIPKPFSEDLIKQLIINDPVRFIINSDRTIRLTDDVEFLANYFKNNQTLFNNFCVQRDGAGFLAFIFIGDKFPLAEAEEYVKTRPVIYIALVKNLLNDFKNLISSSGLSELYKFLEVMISPEMSVEEWLKNKVAISFYYEESEELKLLYSRVLEHFSPVLNLSQNPGNLFQYTLKSKLKSFEESQQSLNTVSDNTSK